MKLIYRIIRFFEFLREAKSEHYVSEAWLKEHGYDRDGY